MPSLYETPHTNIDETYEARRQVAPADLPILTDVQDRYQCSGGPTRVDLLPNTINRVYTVWSESRRLVVKIPWQESIDAPRGYEAAVHQAMAEHPTPPPLAIPTFYEYRPETGALVVDYLRGYTETEAGMHNSPPPLQQRIGTAIGNFLAWEQTISPERFRHHTGHYDPGFRHINRILDACIAGFEHPTTPGFANFAREEHRRLTSFYAAGIPASEQQVFHQDLGADNIVFGGNGEPCGVIDFGAIGLSDAARAMRFIDFGNKHEMLESCIAAYQDATGQEVAIDQVECWAGIQNILVLCHQLQRGIPRPSKFFTAQAGYMAHFPGQNIEELYRAVTEQFVPQQGSWKEYGMYGVLDSLHSERNDRRILDSTEQMQALFLGGVALEVYQQKET